MTKKELKEKYGTVSFMILTETMAMGIKYNDPNPFYKATRKAVFDNYEYAKECYNNVLDRLTASYYALNIEAIKDGKIKPMRRPEFNI